MSAHRKESTPGHLLALSDEVSRLATTLARLSTEAGVATSDEQHNAAADAKIVASDVGAFIRARRLRSRFFEDELFADPAWDMMLELARTWTATYPREPFAFNSLAAVHNALGQHDQAVELFGHAITAARALGPRHNPALVAQNLEVTAHGGLRELQYGPDLVYGELVALEDEQHPAPRRIGEGCHPVE